MLSAEFAEEERNVLVLPRLRHQPPPLAVHQLRIPDQCFSSPNVVSTDCMINRLLNSNTKCKNEVRCYLICFSEV